MIVTKSKTNETGKDMIEEKTVTGRIASHPGFAVLCTLAGVALTSFFSWLGVHQSAVINEKSSCISRIDTNERILREHSAEFMSSIGDLINYTVFPPSNRPEDLSKVAGPVIKQGFAISAYAPLPLSLIALKISMTVQQASLASMGYANQEAAIASVNESFGKWPSTFAHAMQEFDKQRSQCGK
ncbi:hypothetical protein JZ09_18230 [Salmonella enterica]|uniref:hypothetical protein n=1 Tax=Klebsiella aerogenes TaxID=548 RepID=UPI0007506C4C|nr:hypothetical protein [Klebsiella aerogenes]EAA7344700.1 hypothetical protein [Salmonella enterica]EBV6531541.1 hypothetical protein [Salmonella enterica subsp. enterica serovar Oranienburg]EFD5185581.1 hypothetical protein [Escherichia coli]HEM7555785.1 hypothetical protein [Serratia marcescens]EBP0126159.1 hypothetical protein [Salmonella enterica]